MKFGRDQKKQIRIKKQQIRITKKRNRDSGIILLSILANRLKLLLVSWIGRANQTNSTQLSGGAACNGSSLVRLLAPKRKSRGTAGSSRNTSAFAPVCPLLPSPCQISLNHVLLTFAVRAPAWQTCLPNRSLTKPCCWIQIV